MCLLEEGDKQSQVARTLFQGRFNDPILFVRSRISILRYGRRLSAPSTPVCTLLIRSVEEER